jgi:hypothetical protein
VKDNTWNVVNSVIALVALLVAIFASWYTRKQVVLIKEERTKRDGERQEMIEWSIRATGVQQHLMKFILKFSNGLNGASMGPLYPTIINDESLRGLVEAHLVTVDLGRNRLEAHQLNSDILSMPVVRETIQKVEQRFEEVRRDAPQLARQASLL